MRLRTKEREKRQLDDCRFSLSSASGLYGLWLVFLTSLLRLRPSRTPQDCCGIPRASRAVRDRARLWPHQTFPRRQRYQWARSPPARWPWLRHRRCPDREGLSDSRRPSRSSRASCSGPSELIEVDDELSHLGARVAAQLRGGGKLGELGERALARCQRTVRRIGINRRFFRCAW